MRYDSIMDADLMYARNQMVGGQGAQVTKQRPLGHDVPKYLLN